MPPSPRWPTTCSAAFADEQIVSALELKLRAFKQDLNEYWRLDAAFRLNRRRPARRSRALVWLRGVKQEKEE
jgi:hypothetical protein